MKNVNLAELPLSAKVGIIWSFFWRGIAIALGSALCGLVLGALAGLVFGIAGVVRGAPVAGGLLGAATGITFTYLYLRWLLASRLGKFRLLLVSAER